MAMPARHRLSLIALLAMASFGALAATAPNGSITYARDPAQPVDPGPALEMRTGDDVVHASFGDGVVTGTEPGGVIVVRFDDGKERKLMADYAPIRKK